MRPLSAVFAVALVAGSVSAGTDYTAVLVPPLPFGTGTVAFGCNDSGWVVGQADGFSGVVGFVYRHGVTEALPLLEGGSDGQANAINNAGIIVGQCRDINNTLRPVMWTVDGDGLWQITDLGTFALDNSGFGVATRINEAGQIVGYATAESSPSYHGFLLAGGVRTDIGTLEYSGSLAYSQALGVSESGHVSGYAYRVLGGPEHGLARFGDRASDITPVERFGLAQWHAVADDQTLAGYVSGSLTEGAFRPATWSDAGGFSLIPLIDGLPEGFGYDMNNDHVVVGAMFLLSSNPDENIFRAFASSGGVTTDLSASLPELPGPITEARDISPAGLIAGTIGSPTGPIAVLLVPGASCAADFNADGDLNPDDLGDYINCYFAVPSCEGADFNRDGAIDPDDLGDFINAYFAGCD
ncbi:MAG: hypothetical protein AB7K52_04255 [Phycisphaerales bacterium]